MHSVKMIYNGAVFHPQSAAQDNYSPQYQSNTFKFGQLISPRQVNDNSVQSKQKQSNDDFKSYLAIQKTAAMGNPPRFQSIVPLQNPPVSVADPLPDAEDNDLIHNQIKSLIDECDTHIDNDMERISASMQQQMQLAQSFKRVNVFGVDYVHHGWMSIDDYDVNSKEETAEDDEKTINGISRYKWDIEDIKLPPLQWKPRGAPDLPVLTILNGFTTNHQSNVPNQNNRGRPVKGWYVGRLSCNNY
ncbi:hypothetical protein MIR68_010440 [Amoeboaphelidium protococcarum]|nr:hypothetical protein MIR68_010440 [Amoeboaphelidium protococcarum]